MKARLLFLGTGTSVGIPVIGCRCKVCSSKDQKNKRFRTGAAVIFDNGQTTLLDATVDFRAQALKFNLERVDIVLLTHHHADHIFGLDELRIYNYYQDSAIPIYIPKYSYNEVRKVFSYSFRMRGVGGGVPIMKFIKQGTNPIAFNGTNIQPVTLYHGETKIFGYRIGKMAYLTDVSAIPESSLAQLGNLDILVLSMLRYRRHSTHLSYDEAVELAERIGAKKTYFTHMSHAFDHNKLKKTLPGTMEPAYDGLMLEFEVNE
ncbi:MAG: MBL fold metallo-hydrolase [Acidobacteria bacterium]|nr:MBL fold metallo-hydrolase [Acidobacteriota bacterium]